jgi:hypothetical protein
VKSRSSYFRSSSFDERSRACEFIHYAKLREFSARVKSVSVP